MTIPKQLLEAKICNKNTCELNQRIDKAIEYLENWEANFYAYDTGEDKDNIKELLDILKGSDSND